MKNFGLIFQYEIKKITHRKLWLIAFAAILLFTILLNLCTIFDFSVGWSGAQVLKANKNNDGLVIDKSAFFNGIPIYYVNDSDELVEEKVSQLKYIQMQRQFAMEWSGKPIDNETIREMQAFIDEYDFVGEKNYSYGWSIQNYYWVYRTINYMGLNPRSENMSEENIKANIESQRDSTNDGEQLTKEEKEYWSNHTKLEYPLKMAYTCAYKEIIDKVHWINLVLLLYVIVVLCDTCTLDQTRRLSSIIRSTQKGTRKAIVARLCAGMTVTIVSALVLYGFTTIFQFGLFGTDGFHTPIQQIGGYQWSSLMISAGQAVLLVCLMSIILAIMTGAITMLLSELLQNSIGAILLPCVFLLYSLLFDKSIFHRNRELSQLWQYFPIQRIPEILYDGRMVSVGNKMFEAIPLSLTIYFSLSVLALTLCAIIAFLRKCDRK